MNKGQNTRGYARYIACDIHREYILVGGQNEGQVGVLTPRRISLDKFPEWAKKNLRQDDIVILETTTNVGNLWCPCSPGEPDVGGQCCLRSWVRRHWCGCA